MRKINLTLTACFLTQLSGCTLVNWFTERSPEKTTVVADEEAAGQEELLASESKGFPSPPTRPATELPVGDAARTSEITKETPKDEAAPVKSSEADQYFVEMLWRVPDEAATAYHIRYGLTKTNMDNHSRILTSKLEKFEHPLYGMVYRYKLYGTPRDREVYVSIQAENEAGALSHSSAQLTVQPVE